MSYTIQGKVLSIGQVQQLPSKDPSRPFYKRELVIDCTRHDPVTGQRSPYENTPMLEFTGDIVRELDSIQVGQFVIVTFEVQGTKYVDKNTRQEKIFTRLRPFKIDRNQFDVPAMPQVQGQQPMMAQQQPAMTYDPLSQTYQPQPQAAPQPVQQKLFNEELPF